MNISEIDDRDIMARNLRRGIELMKAQRIADVFDNKITFGLWMSVMIYEKTGAYTTEWNHEMNDYQRRQYIHGLKTAALRRKLQMTRRFF